MKRLLFFVLFIPTFVFAEDIPSYNDGNKPVVTPVVSLFSNYSSAANGVGTTKNLDFPASSYTWQTVISGSPSAINITLEGTLDGSNWFVLDTSTSISSEMRHVVNKPILTLRGKVNAVTGGTSPRITSKIIAVGR